jgi:hypothetical protein
MLDRHPARLGRMLKLNMTKLRRHKPLPTGWIGRGARTGLAAPSGRRRLDVVFDRLRGLWGLARPSGVP